MPTNIMYILNNDKMVATPQQRAASAGSADSAGSGYKALGAMNSPSDHNEGRHILPDGCTSGEASGGGLSRTLVEAVRYEAEGEVDPEQDTCPCSPPSPPAVAAPRQQSWGAAGADSDAVRDASASHPLDHGRRERCANAQRWRSEILNAIETRLGSDLEEHFDEYLAAIGVTVLMGRSVEDTRLLMTRHLRDNGILHVHGDSPPPWEIVQSPLGGRGVIATRDLKPGDLILKDAPLVVGARAGNDTVCPSVCVGCCQAASADKLRACPRGCRLPVCAEGTCHEASSHLTECDLLRRWLPSGDPLTWSADLLRASAPVRCLALPPERREILASMQSHHGRQHAFEVDLLLELVQRRPTADEERFMRLACCVMDANAFRMIIPCQEGRTQSWLQAASEGARPPIGVLRGLYPLGALLNHGCTPNTRHTYDARGHMVVRCVREVRAGEELTVTYSALLWGTPARRQHLLRTKHFLCGCARCQDPTEGGTCLSALPCPARPCRCRGPVLPVAPLSLGSDWRCSECGIQVPAGRASLLQSVLGGLLGSLYPAGPTSSPSPEDIQHFLRDNEHILPPTNHISIELKADVVWGLGHRHGYTFPELSADQLRLKDDLCRDLLSVLSALQAGQCSLAGMLHYERHCTIMERVRRDPGLFTAVAGEALETIETANVIIGEDNGCPPELADALLRTRAACASASAAPAPSPCDDADSGSSASCLLPQSPQPAPAPPAPPSAALCTRS